MSAAATPLDPRRRDELARALVDHAAGRRWFRGKARPRRGANVADVIPLAGGAFAIVLLTVDYADGPPETYVLPVGLGAGGELAPDATAAPALAGELLRLMRERAVVTGEHGELAGHGFERLGALAAGADLTPAVGGAEQSNTSIIYGRRLLLKLFRAIEEGPNAEYEIGRFFATHAGAPRAVAALAGAIEHRVPGREPSTLAVLSEFVPNQGDAWRLVLQVVGKFLDGVATGAGAPTVAGGSILERAARAGSAGGLVGADAARLRLLGVRTAEMHVALAQDLADPLFAPEPFDAGHLQALRASARALADRTFAMLRDRAPALAGETRALADEILARRAEVDRTLESIAARRLDAVRIRIHGDYHLGQVLATGADFVIIDFEGEPGRPLAERRHKLGPLRDVAGMVRSLDYAGAAALRERDGAGRLGPWTRAWSDDAAATFVAGYLERARGTALLPASPADAATLLDFYLVEKCVYEIGYELNNRPDWLAIPLAGLRRLLGGPP